MSKEVTERQVDLDPGPEEEAPRPSLSDFLSVGLRESQRPPRPQRTASDAPGPTPVEPATPPSTSDEAARSAGGLDAHDAKSVSADDPSFEVAESGGGEAPGGDSRSSEPIEDEYAGRTTDVAFEDQGESESDYVVPIPWFSRPRILGGAGALVLLTIALAWWSLHGGKESRAPVASLRVSVPVTHEPLPPPPPPPAIEPQPPSAELEDEGFEHAPRVGGVTAPAEPSASAPASYGPNVARYPDLPTPVLIQLEKDRQEAKKKK